MALIVWDMFYMPMFESEKETSDVLAGKRPANAGVGPKIHIDPRKD
jgi:hypothetical protein